MTINTTKPDLATEPPITSKTQPGLGVPRAASEPDLESRIKARRAELIAKLCALRTDTRLEVIQASDKLKAKLSEIAHILKESVVDGWASLGDNVKHKLEHWLAESNHQLSTSTSTSTSTPTPTPTQDVPPKIEQSR
jgi:hypothetical protein